MYEATHYDRRRFLGITAMTVAAAHLGTRGVAHAQPRQTTPSDGSTMPPHTNSAFGLVKQIEAGLLNVGYVEVGAANSRAVLLLHGWPYDIYSYVDVAPLLASAGYRMTTKMYAAQISKPGGEWEVVERVIPEPHAGHVRVKVEACGMCHSDVFVKDGLWPGLQYPRVPGHEVAGRIDAVGDNVTASQKGQRVGVGWHGGHCFVCDQCRRGDFAMCVNRKVTGIDFDGGYAEYMIAPVIALAAIPEELPAEEAGPFMCAGVTVYNALRNSGARAGEVVAVHGIGGLGHLGVQYARQMGFETVAINRGNDKEALARQLGAHHYIDALAQDAVTELQKLGGARDFDDRPERASDLCPD